MGKPNLLVFASGSPEGGGSGFEKLVDATENGILRANIVGVVSNHADGRVRKRAKIREIPFLHFPGPWTAEGYQKIASDSGADFFALSGWLKLVCGLDLSTPFNPKTVFNIHPGPLPQFGGPGMHGHHVHEQVLAAYRRNEIFHSAVCMHFVTSEYDRGPVFFERKVRIYSDDTPATLAARVNRCEHFYQARLTHSVVNGEIYWEDGVNPDSLKIARHLEVEQFV